MTFKSGITPVIQADLRRGMMYRRPSSNIRIIRRMSLLRFHCAWVVSLFGLCTAAALGSDKPLSEVIGTQIQTIDLADFHGRQYALADFGEYDLLVVAFMGVECPLAKQYASRLVELADQYEEQGVGFVGIDSNVQDSLEELSHFARTHGIDFPVLRDRGHEAANRFDARRTPEVFVLDRDRTIRYRGRIDDQYGFKHGTGYQRSEAKQEDLANAIESLLAGRAIEVPATEAPGCLISRTREPDPSSPVTWSNQISRLFQRSCQECHRPGEIAPFSLMSHEDVVGWEAMIQEVVNQNRMPPWHADDEHGEFSNDCRLTAEEKDLINVWVEHGAPEGDPSDLPQPREFVKGWQMGEPDVVYYMREEPFQVPAEGLLEYEYFIVDPGFTEDRWLRACECRPGNHSVVHHINVFILPPELDDTFLRDQLTNRLLKGYAPGFRPEPFPEGMASRVRAGSRFVFQMHYTPVGTPQEDRSYMGVLFAEDDEVEQSVEIALAFNAEFVIPPEASHHDVKSMYEFKTDATLFALIPHMHLRGKSFRYDLLHIDGTIETLLHVPHYDFNWQSTFDLKEPRELPAGTLVECTAVFDNSEENLANPDPSSSVTWGDQTTDEMMIGYLCLAKPKDLVDTPNAPPELPVADASPGVRFGTEPILWALFGILLLGGSTTLVVFSRRMRRGVSNS